MPERFTAPCVDAADDCGERFTRSPGQTGLRRPIERVPPRFATGFLGYRLFQEQPNILDRVIPPVLQPVVSWKQNGHGLTDYATRPATFHSLETNDREVQAERIVPIHFTRANGHVDGVACGKDS